MEIKQMFAGTKIDECSTFILGDYSQLGVNNIFLT